MDQSTVVILALGVVLLVAFISVILLGRNAARSEITDVAKQDTQSQSSSSDVEQQATSARIVTRVKPSEEEIGISRRKFMNRSIYAFLGLGVLPAFGLSLLSFLMPTGKGGFGGLVNVTTPLDEILAQVKSLRKPFYIPEARAYVVQFPNENPAAVEAAQAIQAYSDNPKVLDGMVEDGVVVLYQSCPHLGCRVPWCETSQWFECPCHGSKFNRVGEKRGGPAPRGMDRFSFDVNGGKLIIDTGTVVSGPPIGTDTTRQGAEGPLCV